MYSNKGKYCVTIGKDSFVDCVIVLFKVLIWMFCLAFTVVLTISSFYTFFVVPGYGIFDAIAFAFGVYSTGKLVKFIL